MNTTVLELYGTHGTHEEAARSIINTGFRHGAGRGGSGVYFWHKNAFSTLLAEGWYNFSSKNNPDYKISEDSPFTCIEVKINVDNRNFLDLEHKVVKDRIAEIVLEKGYTRKIEEEEISAIYDRFVSRLEKELETNFYVRQLRVNPPITLRKSYPQKIIGNPLCYVVNNNSLISLLSCYVKEDNSERRIH